MKKRSKVIIDTNLWISFSLSKKLDFIENFVVEEELQLLYSSELIKEIKEVFNRTKFSKTLPKDSSDKILNALKIYGKEIIIFSDIKVCRDKKDNFLLSLCKDGKAEYLITGDKDLLILKEFENTKIITFTQFLNI